MKIGLQIIRFDWPGSPINIGERLREIGRLADEVGFASLWVMDHFFQINFSGPPEDAMLEGYTTAALLAAVTRQIKVGVLVTGVQYRYPGILIKTATTLDVLSGGRSYFGIGAGWFEHESVGLGAPFPPLAERYERLEETLQIARQMWADDVTPYHGRYYQLHHPICHPQPLNRPHPPILIGGMGEQKTLRLVAQYGDACNLSVGVGTDRLEEKVMVVSRKLDVLKQHCEAVKRPYEEIERTALGTVLLETDGRNATDIIAYCRALHNAGIQHLILNMENVHELTPLEIFGREIIPAVARFG